MVRPSSGQYGFSRLVTRTARPGQRPGCRGRRHQQVPRAVILPRPRTNGASGEAWALMRETRQLVKEPPKLDLTGGYIPPDRVTPTRIVACAMGLPIAIVGARPTTAARPARVADDARSRPRRGGEQPGTPTHPDACARRISGVIDGLRCSLPHASLAITAPADTGALAGADRLAGPGPDRLVPLVPVHQHPDRPAELPVLPGDAGHLPTPSPRPA